MFDDGFVMRLIAVIVRDGSILAVDGNFFKRQAASSAGLTDADDDVRIKFIDALFKQRTVFSKNDRQRICILAVAIVSGKSFKASYEGLIFSPPNGSKPVIKIFFIGFPPFLISFFNYNKNSL